MTTTDAEPGRAIDLASVPNFRDLGGYRARDGARVRSGVLYRSTQLANLAAVDRRAFDRLGIRTLFDLRTEFERGAAPDPVLDTVEYVVADVMAGSNGPSPAQLLRLLEDPHAAAHAFGGSRTLELFSGIYREVVSLDSALAGYRRLFTGIARTGRLPALVHCTTGKDRTGWAAAATLMLLEVPDRLVMRDYLLSNTYLLPAFAPVFDRFRANGGDPELLRPVVGVESAYLQAALEEMRTRFGSIEGYFADGLGIDADGQDELRDALLEPAAA